MADNFGVYNITGRVETMVSSSVPGTQDIRSEHAVAHAHPAFVDSDTFPGPGIFIFDDNYGIGELTVIHLFANSPADLAACRVGDTVLFKPFGAEGSFSGSSQGVLSVPAGTHVERTVTEVGSGVGVDDYYIRIAGLSPFFVLGGLETFQVIRKSRQEPVVTGLNNRRLWQRDVYNRLVQGRAFRYEIGQAPAPANPGQTTYIPAQANLRPFGEQQATAPSWTQLGIGKHHEFVINELSASQYEASSLNTRFSGTQALERSPVPASSSMYYSKQSRFQKITYKLSASAGLPEVPGNTRGPSQLENKPRNVFHSVSGSYRNNDYFRPAVFSINVPERGKIRDVKVWVELVHDHRGGTGTGSADASNPFYGGGSGSTIQDTRVGLQGLQIALRSPNVSFKNAHPMWNDPYVTDLEKSPSQFNPNVSKVPDLLRGSYLLWAGHQVEQDLGRSLGRLTSSVPDNKNNFQTVWLATSSSLASTHDLFADQFDRTHAVFNARLGGRLMYASSSINDNTWPVLLLSSSNAVQEHSNDYMQVVVGKDPLVKHIAFVDSTDQRLVHIRLTGSFDTGVGFNKTFTNVNTNLSPYYSFISLDANEAPAISWGALFTQEIFLSRSGSTGFVTEKVSPNLLPRYGPTYVFFDSSGSPDVFYLLFDGTIKYTIVHARSGSTTGWKEYPIFSGALLPGKETEKFAQNIGSLYGVARDSSGGYHIATSCYFYDADDAVSQNAVNRKAGVVYLRSGSTGWAPELVLSSSVRTADFGGQDVFAVTLNSIAVGTDLVPHVVFQRSPPSGLGTVLYARSGNLGWSVQELDTGVNNPNNFIGPNRIVVTVDRNNEPHMLWKDGENTTNSDGSGSLDYVRLHGPVSGAAYFSFDKDIDMRTVFDDGSPNKNPRHIEDLFPNRTNSSPGVATFPSLRLRRAGSYPSPLSSSVTLFGASSSFRALRPYEGGAPIDQVHFLTGANFPWMLDSRMPPGNFVGRTYSATGSLGAEFSSSYAIPKGWLNGAGGSNDVNEWPTKGIQLGPATIQPVYPLLDDIFVEKVFDQFPENATRDDQGSLFSPARLPANHPRISGFRPGLRGTEVNGTWKLLVGNTWDTDPLDTFNTPPTGSVRGGFWFRQFRLEFIIDTGQPEQYPTYAGRARKYSKPTHVPSSYQKRIVHIISGSSEWDTGVNYVSTTRGDDYGLSVGITSATGTTDFAVFSQLTGSLVAALSASNKLDGIRSTFLSNEFGTPYVPVTSGSGEVPTFDAFTSEDALEARQTFQEVLVPTTLVPRDNTLRAFLARSRTVMSTRDSLVERLKK